MKKLLVLLAFLMLLGTLAYGQCLPPTVNGVPQIIGPGSAPDYFGCANYASSPLPKRSCSISGKACYGDIECALEVDPLNPNAVSTCSGPITGGGIRKFIDKLPGVLKAGQLVPGVTPFGANDRGQYIPIAVADTTTYPGSDYYEIAVVQYEEQMHTDLPPTKLRGYVQLETSTVTGSHYSLGNGYYGVDKPHYLGPSIVAQKDRPVRILFRNLLPPTESGGNLFIPVDTTVMGSGMGPEMMGMTEQDSGLVTDGARNPMCNMTPKNPKCFAENRATLHLHGGITPWISDGTPHQWITPDLEDTHYPKGVSVKNVPDMPDPGPGAMTFFYTNQQSARLMFYHDHAWGITRLNVYAGEAAGYLITDPTEQKLMAAGGPLDGLGIGIPLIIQDRTFVPTPDQLAVEDPTWDTNRWGGFGNIWVPHVYMPAQNPDDPSGGNAFGRWMYGPWFWPPASPVYPPINNPYYDPSCDPNTTWCQPQLIPGTPNQSVGMEHFNDTPIVNGTAYPTLELPAGEYRFRILNAANDRFWNLQWYVADSTGTEVALNAAELAAAQEDPNVFPTPDTNVSPAGPGWLQIGTEGGFLPDPVVVRNQPITWIINPTRFDVGNVDKHSLLLAPAERADVIVDFTPFAGKTLILYNDAPAAFPARVATYDYYTGAPDQTDAGGAPAIQPGYGPNTRTVMQVKITGGGGGTPVSNWVNPSRLSALQAAFQHHLDADGNPAGVFESSQNPIIVGQAAYNKAYGTNFRSAAPRNGIARINDFSMTFDTLLGGSLTIPFEPKALHDEMNSADFDEYGRMTANIGLEKPNPGPATQNVILYPYINPPTELLNAIQLPSNDMKVTPIQSSSDGTQIWRITHNGVDTHPIHFHLFDVQLLNRVTWDNIIIYPDPNELGWKDTVRVSPLEDTIVALRPIIPKIPFGVPISQRPLNPSMPLGNGMGFNSVDPNGNPMNPPITNQVVNFGWEYVWHCHILGHEEMDMMRPIAVNVPSLLPAAPVLSYTKGAAGVSLTWTDGTPVDYSNVLTWGSPAGEIGYRIERAPIANGQIGDYTEIAGTLANITSYIDTENPDGTGAFSYRVVAYNAAGDSTSEAVNVAAPPAAAVSPTALTFGAQQVNTPSSAQSITLSNTGSLPLNITGVALQGTNAADFAQTSTCGATVAGGSNCTINVTFTPTGIRRRTASLVINSNDPINPQLTVPLAGDGVALTLSRTVANFGPVVIGQTSYSLSTNVTNFTGAPATISIAAPSPWSVTANSCTGTIANNATCSFTMVFTPTTAGRQTGNVTISANGVAATLPVEGTGVVPSLTLSRTVANFGPVVIGQTSYSLSTNVTNLTGAPAAISIAAPSPWSVTANSCTGTIANNATCSFTTVFTPTTAGRQTGNVTVSANGVTATLPVEGTGIVSSLKLSRTVANFGPVVIGQTSYSLSTNVTNSTGAPATISIAAPSPWSVTANSCTGTIANNATCSFTMVFTPTTAGRQTGNVTVSANGVTATLPVEGTGVVPSLTLSRTVANFGSVVIGQTSYSLSTNVTNLTGAPAAISIATPSAWSVTANSCTGTIANNATCSFTLVFTPTTAGRQTGNVTVSANGVTATLPVEGTGI